MGWIKDAASGWGDILGNAGNKVAATFKNTQGKKHASNSGDVLAAQMEASGKQQYEQNKLYADELAAKDKEYVSGMSKNVGQYQKELDDIRGQIASSQRDARSTYDSTIQPRMKDMMEKAGRNAGGAMTLQEAMDPNNAVAAGTRKLYSDEGDKQRAAYADQGAKTRDLYNTEADFTRGQYNDQGANVQKLYEQQALNEGRQGLADTGVLSALGMQNMAGQLGGIPMTGGQLQALMGANQAQAGAAYSKNVARQNSLRDLGITGNLGLQKEGLGAATGMRSTGLGRQADFESQGLGRQSDLGAYGIDQGFARTDRAYDQGRQAVQDYNTSIGNYEGAFDRQLGRDMGFRNEAGQNSGQSYNLQQAMAGAVRDSDQAGINRQLANYNTMMGGNQANLGAQMQNYNAGRAADAAVNSGVLQAAGTVAGSFAGPAGAAAGAALAKRIGDSQAPAAQTPPPSADYGDMGPSASGGGYGGDALALYGADPYAQDSITRRMRTA